MDITSQFYKALDDAFTMVLATSSNESVTMRTVSPILVDDSVLIFTNNDSKKFLQMTENPHCCFSVGIFFAEADVEFFGSTMLDNNADFRKAYEKKFPGAFDEGIEFGGRNSDFVLLRPTRITGWAFADGIPTPDGVPNMPFSIEL